MYITHPALVQQRADPIQDPATTQYRLESLHTILRRHEQKREQPACLHCFRPAAIRLLRILWPIDRILEQSKNHLCSESIEACATEEEFPLGIQVSFCVKQEG